MKRAVHGYDGYITISERMKCSILKYSNLNLMHIMFLSRAFFHPRRSHGLFLFTVESQWILYLIRYRFLSVIIANKLQEAEMHHMKTKEKTVQETTV